MRQGLYYIESVTALTPTNNQTPHNGQQSAYPTYSGTNDLNGFAAVLLYIPNDYLIDSNSSNPRQHPFYVRHVFDTFVPQEDTFIKVDEDGLLSDGSSDHRAVKITEFATSVFSELNNQPSIRPNLDRFDSRNIDCLYSYHINVGNGNHTLIVFRTADTKSLKAWLVDFGCNYAKRNKYYDNIEHCIDHICQRFNIDKLHIDVAMLTHRHFDHYGAFKQYFSKDSKAYIDSKTLFFIDTQHKSKNIRYIELLKQLIAIKCNILAPIQANSTPNIKIFNPVIDGKMAVKKPSVNNQSSVFSLEYDGTTHFLFPGDLERDGLNALLSSQPTFVHNTRHYAVSHHGSLNGHLCNCPQNRTHQHIAQCISSSTKAIVMGRNGAYRGIYSPDVIGDWGERLLYSQHDPHNNQAAFLELNLLNSNAVWHF